MMDSLIDLNDASKALDLSRIRYQLMYVCPIPRLIFLQDAQWRSNQKLTLLLDAAG